MALPLHLCLSLLCLRFIHLSFIHATYFLSMPTLYLCLSFIYAFIYAFLSAVGHGASGQFCYGLVVTGTLGP